MRTPTPSLPASAIAQSPTPTIVFDNLPIVNPVPVAQPISVPPRMTASQFVLQQMTGINPTGLVLKKWSPEWYKLMDLRLQQKWLITPTFNFKKVSS
jgi:hypothetical protein